MADRRPTCIGIGISMGIASTVAVALRFRARKIKNVPLGPDDWTILLSLIFSLGLCATIIVGALRGNMGGHELGPNGKPVIIINEFVVRSKCIWVVQWLAALGPGAAKISILFFYRRIFQMSGKIFNILTWTLMALSVIWTISFFCANFFGCEPISGNWVLGPANCINPVPVFYSMTYSDIILDALILTLPWYPVYKLVMPLGRKLLVVGIFLLGGFVVGAGIARVCFLVQAINDTTGDHSYTRTPVFYWGAIESCVGVISACLPTLRPLFSSSSLDTIMQNFSNKISSLWSRSDSTSGSIGTVKQKYQDIEDRTSQSSLVHHKPQYTADDMQMHSIFNEPGSKREFSHDSHMV